jgi:RNA polymerase sigma factor (sigma-70 family)
MRVNERFVEKVTEDAIVRAFGSSFDRDTPGEFFSWLDTIVQRTIVDFYRSPDAKTARQTVPLADDDSGRDDSWDDFPYERVEAADAIARALAMLDNEMHREVIELYEFQDRPAREVAHIAGTSENNVHAISSRFRRMLRALIEEGGSP